MRKIAAIATIISLTLGISACDQNTSKNQTQQTTKVYL